MSKTISFRRVVAEVSKWTVLIHIGLYLAIPRDYHYRYFILGVLALVIALIVGTLWQTKQTLPEEPELPKWLYPFATFSWGFGATVWLALSLSGTA